MNNLVWFRNDLRTKDNQSLFNACTEREDQVIGVYCFDPRHFDQGPFGFKKTEKYRARFLVETVLDLKKNLEKLNIPLLVYHQKPEVLIPTLTKQFKIDHIYLQKEWTSEENKVLEAVKSYLPSTTALKENYDQFLFHPEDIPFDRMEHVPEVFTAFRKKLEKYSAIRPCLHDPSPRLPEHLISNDTAVPTLEDLGFQAFSIDQRSAFPFQGGETKALSRIENYFWETKNLATYKRTRNGLVGEAYSSKLSPWLANGSISPRTIYWEVKHFEQEVQKNQDTYWLVFELIWRDYFKYISLKHRSKIFQIGGLLNKNYDWGTDDRKKAQWINGHTKYPFVNANMKELALTGWMSNRGRQNVASFWAKEICQDWRIGAAYFESMLLDYDVHSNWGNWMYNSGVGNDPRDRKFNIGRQAEMYDPSGKFQKLWLQESLF
ncbi:DASH family cryptochrome [Sediminicola sp. 1XM1-17]|uniref:DASH family cryptochrome n=1 Tax=Sediminicola sp. 1XM1-17 TaxID=3127702 RepID=UPI003077CBB0